MAKKFVIVILMVLSFLFSYTVFADQKEDLAKKIEEYQQKLNQLAQQRDSLSAQIQYMTTQINLTTYKIQDTEEKIVTTQKEIETLGSRIGGLDDSLTHLSKLLLNKVVAGYKKRSLSFFDVIFNSDNANDFLDRVKYLKTAQQNNQKILVQVQETKLNFEEQKKLRETKKTELDTLEKQLNEQKVQLDSQKAAKQKLLSVTQNDEKAYQRLLEQARAEYAAIQGIIAGAGTEAKMRDVKKGDMIASIIPGASCNSSGTHLHFIVQENNNVANPFNYLKSVDFNNCSASSCGAGDADPFNPSGSWDWPLNSPIELEQGYGATWAVRNTWAGRIYSFHNGVDINGSSNNVNSVGDGELYKGSYSVGCTLSYVKVVHKDSSIVTFYLHVYPQ